MLNFLCFNSTHLKIVFTVDAVLMHMSAYKFMIMCESNRCEFMRNRPFCIASKCSNIYANALVMGVYFINENQTYFLLGRENAAKTIDTHKLRLDLMRC